ncbi:hypothetical protein [Cryptosporangium sp. NPDC051539]|uniref:hypothetical protein n=1 Tax=Cryptosporangium sp. NPDC051539 TaxID=3363962 RepID=UPI0037B5FF04
MKLDVGLGGVRLAHHAADPLDGESFESDRAGEEQGVQAGDDEAFTCDFVDRDENQRPAFVGGEGAPDGIAFGLGEPTAEGQPFQAVVAEAGGEGVDVLDAVGEHDAVPAAAVGVADVGGDEVVADRVGGELAVDGLDRGAVGAGFGGGESGEVDGEPVREVLFGGDLAPEEQTSIVTMSSMPSARNGVAVRPSHRLTRMLRIAASARRAKAVAFVHDGQTVAVEYAVGGVAVRDRLQHDQIHYAAAAVFATTEASDRWLRRPENAETSRKARRRRAEAARVTPGRLRGSRDRLSSRTGSWAALS